MPVAMPGPNHMSPRNANGSPPTVAIGPGSASPRNSNPYQDAVIKQLDVIKANSRQEAENQKAWGQAIENRLENVCTNMRCELQGSLKLAVEGLKRSITDQIMEALHKRQINEKKVYETLLATVREEQGEAHKEFNDYKVTIAGHLRRLDQLVNRKLESGPINGQAGVGGSVSKATIDHSVKRMEEKIKKDLETVVGLNDRVTAISTRSKSETAGLKDMIEEIKEQARADVDRLTKMVSSISGKSQADLAELKETASSITAAQQTFESLEARIQQSVERSEHGEREVAQLTTKVNGMHGEILDLTAAVTAQARREIEEKLDKQCSDLQEEVDQRLRQSRSEMLTEMASLQCKQKQAILDKLPNEIEAIKTGFEEQKQVMSKRFSFVAGQIEDMSASLRDDQRSRQDFAQELGDRLDRKIVGVEHRIRAEQQKGVDDMSLKHRESMREMQETLQKLHSESLSRRVTEAQGLLEERLQGQLQNLQQKTSRSVEELRSSMDRQKSHFTDHLAQESATREACEGRLQLKVENALKELSADHEALWKRCSSKERSLLASPEQGVGRSFNWEDEARRLWEALDGHTHDVTSYDEQNATTKSNPSSGAFVRGASPQGAGTPSMARAATVTSLQTSPSTQRTGSPAHAQSWRSSSSGALLHGLVTPPSAQGVSHHVRSPRTSVTSVTSTVKHMYKQ